MDDESASVTTLSCLAVSDKRPGRSGGCVGVFFQLFDWNRRFAKKNKLFSKRLLPPDRAKQALKKFGGDEKQLPNLKLITDENSGSFPNKNSNDISSGNNPVGKNGVQTLSLVARLMGLESMPSVQRNKLLKDSSVEFRGSSPPKPVGENDELDTMPSKQDFRPQKLQKTGMVDRRNVTRFGTEALHLKNVLTRSRKHHHHHPKLASPVPNTNHQSKRNKSRLIGAATRVLESGLQARNKSKYAISYGARNRMKGENLDLLSQQASCKNCGTLIDIPESKSKRDVDLCVLKSSFDQEQESQPQSFKSSKRYNRRLDDVRVLFNGETKDFVALNRNLTGQTRSRIPGKVEDLKFDKRCKFENGSSQWQKRKLMRKGPRMGSEAWKLDYQGQIPNKNSDETAFRFNSTMKNRCEMPTKLERRRNNQRCSSNPSDEKICLQKPFPLKGDSLGALVEKKLQELTSRVRYDSRINGNRPKRISAIMERRITRNTMEFNPKWNHLPRYSRCRNDHNTKFCLQTKLQTSVGLIGRRDSDYLSPGSVLEAPFSNDSCCSSSLEDSSAHTQHVDCMTYNESQFQESKTNPFYSGVLFRKESTHNKLSVDLLTYISQVLSTVDIVDSKIMGNMRAHIKRVVFNAELVLSNQMPHKPTELNSFFICDVLLELDTLAELIKTKLGYFLGSQNTAAGYQRFVFDVVIEYLESKYTRYSKCGFRTWLSLPPFMGFDVLVHEVVEEVRRWIGFVGVISDELVEGDTSHCLGEWTDFGIEVYETGAKIESDILQMLVDEIVVDIYGIVWNGPMI